MRQADMGLLMLRLGVGAVLVGHGAPKLFGGSDRTPPEFLGRLMGKNYEGAWRQSGPENFGSTLEKLKVPKPTLAARVSGAAELGGGLALALGAGTRVMGPAVVANMAVAIRTVHWQNGLYGEGGFEFPLILGAGAACLSLTGAGALSLDRLLRRG
ncbi:MAG: DoxX family protein [Candidatus Dormibacteria bacterium]